MRKGLSWFLLLAALLGILAGCRQSDSEANPLRGRSSGTTPPALIDEPLVVTVSDLALAPTAYYGRVVRLTGRFRRLPVLTCSDVTRRSPAVWSLTDAADTVLVNGTHDQLARLAPGDLTISVQGRWWRWRGPVGCGKDAPLQEVWYLHVSHVLAPNPITAATLTPVGAVAVLPSPTLEPPPTEGGPGPIAAISPTPPPTSAATPDPFATVTATPTVLVTPFTATPSATPSASPTPTPSPPGTPSGTPSATPSPSPTPTPGPSATPGGPTLTPTLIPSVTPIPTAGPSPTPSPTSSGNQEDMGELATQDLVVEVLAPAARHRWTVEVEQATTLTVNVATPTNRNEVVSVTTESGNVLITQNNASGAAPEIVSVALPGAGKYYVIISEATGQGGPYSMILNTTESYNFVFKGTLVYGDASSADMSPDSDHFWHFEGIEGDHIALLVAPADQSDLFIELYGPDAALVFDDPVDDGGAGVPEFLIDFELPETGFYAVRIGEFDYAASDYSISLEDFGSFP